MAFNLEDYEDVATLNKWFINNYPSGRSDISVISHDAVNGYILVQATLWSYQIHLYETSCEQIFYASSETFR